MQRKVTGNNTQKKNTSQNGLLGCESIQKSFGKYCQHIFDAAGVSLFELDLSSGGFLLVPEFFRKYGYKSEEIPKDLGSLKKITHPKDNLMIDKTLEELRDGKQSATLELRVKAGDGSWKWLRVYLWVDKRDIANNFLKLMGIALDVTSLKEAEKLLESREKYILSMLNALPDMMFVISKEGVFLDFKAENTAKLALPPDKIIGRRIDDANFSADDLEKLKNAIAKAFKSGKPQTVDYWLDTLAGKGFYEARISPIDDRKVLLIVRDFTQQKKMQERLVRLGRVRKLLIESTNDLLSSPIETNPYQRFLEKMFSTLPGIGKVTLLLKEGEYLKIAASTASPKAIGLSLPQELSAAYEGIEPAILKFTEIARHLPQDFMTALKRKGLVPPDNFLLVPILSEANKVGFLTQQMEKDESLDDELKDVFVLIASQISTIYKRLQLEENFRKEHKKYKYLATHDALTRLPNRRNLERRFERLQFSYNHFAFAYLSLAKFGKINRAFGHMFADAILVDVAKRLVNLLDSKKKICRLEGANFLLMFPTTNRKQIEEIIQKIKTAFAEPFRIMDIGITLTPIMGIALYPENGMSFAELIQNAEIAAHIAEKEGRELFFFDESRSIDLNRRVFVEQELRKALNDKDQGFAVYFQPLVSLSTGRVEFLEALARWNHPEAGYISPDVFIEIAEESGLIHSLGKKVLDMACEQAREFFDKGIQVPIFINVSALELQRDDIVSQIRESLEKCQIPGNLLGIEITESALIANPEKNIDKLNQLKKLGISIAIDDFGTGYSSLNYLRFLPVDHLKIDLSFVADLKEEIRESSKKTVAIIKSIIALASSLGFSTIAEGVETDSQRQFLKKLGCDYGQGYLFSKPVDAATIEDLLDNDYRLDNPLLS